LHGEKRGDGVRGRIVASRDGVLGTWEVHHSEATTTTQPIDVETGDTIDFITDLRGSIEHDSFNWTVTLRLETTDVKSGQVFDSQSGFHGPLVPALSRWDHLAQVLLMSNEFMFVD